jgi:hypothetical protein
VRTALTDRKDVVNLLDGSESAFLKTHLAEGMLLCVAVTDSFPRSAVGLVHFWGAFIFIVFLPCLFAVLLTVLSVCEVGTTGI